jgi:diguanylate cyclase (GGDEF)-like protein
VNKRNRSRALWWVGGAILALAALNSLRPSAWANLGEDGVSAAAVVAIWVGLFRRGRWSGRPWVYVGLGMTVWVVGDLVWDGYAVAGVVRPDVSLADLFYLAGYPLLALGLYEMARLRAGRQVREGILDGAIFGTAAAVAVWQLLVVPIAAGTRDALTAGVWSAYPLGDVLLIAAAAWLVFSPGRRGTTTFLLLAALVGTFVLDLLYSYLPIVSSFDVARLDWLYPITYLLMAAAALHPDGAELTTPGPPTNRIHPARLLLLGASLGTVPAVAIMTDSTSTSTRVVLLGLTIGLSVAVITRFALTVRARESAQNALAYQATHDELTGTVNRFLVIDRIGHALASDRNPRPLAVMYLDLDRFKSINDTLGHEVGDKLLQEVAHRITMTLRPSDTLGRFGGDEFVVLCEAVTPQEATAIAERIVRTIAEPLDLADRTIHVTISIGLAIGDHRPTGVDLLIRSADEAMYAAKRRGGNRVELYDDELRSHHRARHEIEESLKDAIERGELALHYQPVVRVDDTSIAGFEALLRWQRADGTNIPPADFIPIAEETGLIIPIGDWIIRQACEQLRTLTREGVAVPWISINVSALQLRNENLQRSLRQAIAQTGADPRRLIVELTESALVNDEEAVSAQLQRLRHLGVRVAIDDFGTGYSSLAYLRRLPVDVIKIDQSFVAELVTDAASSSVLVAIVELAHALDLEVIAEGAESHAQIELLQSLGCDYIQGFYYAAAAPAGESRDIALNGLTCPVPRTRSGLPVRAQA